MFPSPPYSTLPCILRYKENRHQTRNLSHSCAPYPFICVCICLSFLLMHQGKVLTGFLDLQDPLAGKSLLCGFILCCLFLPAPSLLRLDMFKPVCHFETTTTTTEKPVGILFCFSPPLSRLSGRVAYSPPTYS